MTQAQAIFFQGLLEWQVIAFVWVLCMRQEGKATVTAWASQSNDSAQFGRVSAGRVVGTDRGLRVFVDAFALTSKDPKRRQCQCGAGVI